MDSYTKEENIQNNTVQDSQNNGELNQETVMHSQEYSKLEQYNAASQFVNSSTLSGIECSVETEDNEMKNLYDTLDVVHDQNEKKKYLQLGLGITIGLGLATTVGILTWFGLNKYVKDK